MKLLQKYFDHLTSDQVDKFSQLQELYNEWNSKVNLISRKDLEQFYERHVLHSLSISYIINPRPAERFLDVGTGGGFPAIPLTILYPQNQFLLVDSIGKKIRVVNEIANALQLTNVKTKVGRMETVTGDYNYITNRAVAPLQKLLNWTKGLHKPGVQLISLKGGDLSEEIRECKRKVEIFPISDFFSEPFFETKKILVINLS